MNGPGYSAFSIDSLIGKSPAMALGSGSAALEALSNRASTLCFGLRSPLVRFGGGGLPTPGSLPCITPDLLFPQFSDECYRSRKWRTPVTESGQGFRPYKPNQGRTTSPGASQIVPVVPRHTQTVDSLDNSLSRLSQHVHHHDPSHRSGDRSTTGTFSHNGKIYQYSNIISNTIYLCIFIFIR